MIAVGLGLIISPVYRSGWALDFTTFVSIQARLSLNEAPSVIPRTGPSLAPIISLKKLSSKCYKALMDHVLHGLDRHTAHIHEFWISHGWVLTESIESSSIPTWIDPTKSKWFFQIWFKSGLLFCGPKLPNPFDDLPINEKIKRMPPTDSKVADNVVVVVLWNAHSSHILMVWYHALSS